MNTQRVLNGRYELGELLGRGGMADVYTGRDTVLGRRVAVKMLRPDLARDPQLQARFRREAQAVAALNHPSIVSVYDTGDQAPAAESPDDVRLPFIVMEYVSGRTLRDLIRAREVTIADAIEHTLGVLSALEYSHRAGIVHRDIKPANVMVTSHGSGVKVMDFGIARAVADSSATMTQTQAVIGTAQYLSPEQARGETVDARSDLYSAACLLYEMLTGRPPFVGDSPVSVAYQHVRETPAPPSQFNPEVSEALDSILARALQKNRSDRFQDAAAFRRALRAAAGGVVLPPISSTEAVTDPTERVAAGSRAALAAGATGTGAAFLDEEPRTRAMARALAGGPLTTESAEHEEPSDQYALDLPAEREPDRRRSTRRPGWMIALLIATLLVLAAGGYWVWSVATAKPAPPPMVAVPSVATLSETDALNKLYAAGFKPSITRVQSNTVEKGTAIGTTPTAGSEIAPQSTVTLTVSSGPSVATIPASIVGQTEAAARDDLRALGLIPNRTTQDNSVTVPRGMVIATKPAPGQVVPIGSNVDIVISTGQVTMPELRGSDRPDAEKALAAIGLRVNVVEKVNKQVEPGKVTSQSETAGTAVDQGATVTLEVAKAAPKPKPTPTPTPTPSPTDTAAPDLGIGG